MDDFFRTPMGRRFFESTMPRLVEELARLNGNVEALLEALRDTADRGHLNASRDKENR
jgi:hypothetical protein